MIPGAVLVTPSCEGCELETQAGSLGHKNVVLTLGMIGSSG